MSKYKLICFDVDGTLVDNIEYSWKLFHDYFQTDKHRREDAKNKFFNGEISYLEWAEHDIGMWRELKVKKEDFFRAIDDSDIKVMDGALEVIEQLKEMGFKIAIISGSINVILEKLIPGYEKLFDHIFFSKIYFNEEGDISKVDATEYDMDGKAKALRIICEKENLDLSECVFIGDHFNDVKVCKEAGLGIAFNCKSEELRKVADVEIKENDLREILKLI
tara:strand:+ start:530 stop:1189 length:660 start_codon:yes stop_codon:yes gene_type:complete